MPVGIPASVVLDAYGIVRKNCYFYILAEAGQGLIYGIVHHLIHQMM